MAKKTKIYEQFSQIEAELKRLGCKHVKLQDMEHQDIVPFNPAKKPVLPKIAEIKKKLSVLPEGIYCVVCQDRFGKNVHANTFYFGKGEYEAGETLREHQERTPSSNSENLLSLESAVENIEKSANLKALNSVLVSENTALKALIAKHEAKIEMLEDANQALSEMEEPERSPFAGLGEFFKELSPVLPGIADRWFNLEEKKMEHKNAKLLMDNGYDVPGATKSAAGQTKENLSKVARPGTKQWPEYIQAVLELPEEKFNKHMKLVEKQFPAIYPKLYEAVYEGEEEEEEEESEEN